MLLVYFSVMLRDDSSIVLGTRVRLRNRTQDYVYTSDRLPLLRIQIR